MTEVSNSGSESQTQVPSINIVDLNDIRTRADSRKKNKDQYKKDKITKEQVTNNNGNSDKSNTKKEETNSKYNNRQYEEDIEDKYEDYQIKFDPTSIYILTAFKREQGIPFWQTLDLLLENNLHKLETIEKRTWMNKLWWVTNDDIQFDKQLKCMIPVIEFPIQGKQSSSYVKIKTNYYNRINELKTSYVYNDMSFAKKLALVTSLQNFEIPLDGQSVTTMLMPTNALYLNRLLRPVRQQFDQLGIETRRFFYEAAILVVFRYSTINIVPEKLELLDQFIEDTLTEILARQQTVILPEEAAQMRAFLKLLNDILQDSENLTMYYEDHMTKRSIIQNKIVTGLKHLNNMKDYYFNNIISSQTMIVDFA